MWISFIEAIMVRIGQVQNTKAPVKEIIVEDRIHPVSTLKTIPIQSS